MSEKYKISKIAGPSMVFSGYLLFLFGAVSVYFTWTSIPVIILGAALALSYTSCFFDFDRKKYRPVLHLFGFIPLGSWMDFEAADQLEVIHFRGSYTTYSRGNRATSSRISDYRLILHRDSDGKKIPIARFETEAEAKELMNRIQTCS